MNLQNATKALRSAGHGGGFNGGLVSTHLHRTGIARKSRRNAKGDTIAGHRRRGRAKNCRGGGQGRGTTRGVKRYRHAASAVARNHIPGDGRILTCNQSDSDHTRGDTVTTWRCFAGRVCPGVLNSIEHENPKMQATKCKLC